MRVSGTITSSRTTICSGNGRTPRRSSTTSRSPRNTSRRARKSTAPKQVEAILDSAHALMEQGVFRYRRPPRPSKAQREERLRKRQQYEEESFNDLWRTLPGSARDMSADLASVDEDEIVGLHAPMNLPEENIIYFLEKHSPVLKNWQREILRIVRNVAQYFYPQMQTKVMNEGCATFVHHYIMNALYDRGQIGEGSILEFLHSHSSVVMQPGFDDSRYYGINPYALGFAMMSRHQAHVGRSDAGRPGLVSGDRRQGRLARRAEARVGELPRRELHPAVPEPEGDARSEALRGARQDGRPGLHGRRHPQRARLSQAAHVAGAALRPRDASAGHPGRRRQSGRRPHVDAAGTTAIAAFRWRRTPRRRC